MAYSPADSGTVVGLASLLAALLLLGPTLAFRLPIAGARVLAWSILLVGTAHLERSTRGSGAGFRMLALVVFALLAMKLVVLIEARASGLSALGFGAWLAFAVTWLGMNPRLFARVGSRPLAGALTLLGRGLGFSLVGVALLLVARSARATGAPPYLVLLLALPALSFCVHFGLCNLLAGGWRWLGVECEPLFRAPLRSEQLGEFWSKRWNLAFSEMTASAVYRPLGKRFGRAAALIAAFALSGLLHELALSVPVRAGYGLPLLYFLLHGGLVLLERELLRRGLPLRGWTGRAWVLVCVVAPLPLLLHPAFLAGVVWPLID